MKINVSTILPAFATLPRVLEEYVVQIPSDQLDVRRLPDAWTIREHIYHIVSVQDMLLGRLRKIHEEPHPVITPFAPEKQVDRDSLYPSVEEALKKYHDYRKTQIAFLHTLTPTDFANEATHPEYVQYNIPVILHHMMFHEYWHLYRIEELWLAREVPHA